MLRLFIKALDLGVTTPGLPAATFESEDISDIIKVDLGQVLLPIQRFRLHQHDLFDSLMIKDAR